MKPSDTLMLLTEMDIAWPDRGVPADDEMTVRVWSAWLEAFDLATARQAIRKFGGMQARPPSLAQILNECRAIAGKELVGADEVLAEFKDVLRFHSSSGTVEPAWFSTPEVGAFAASGAFRDYGLSPDPAFNPEKLASAASAFQAGLRRRWDSFAARCDREGLRAACSSLRLPEAVVAEVCGDGAKQIGDGSS